MRIKSFLRFANCNNFLFKFNKLSSSKANGLLYSKSGVSRLFTETNLNNSNSDLNIEKIDTNPEINYKSIQENDTKNKINSNINIKYKPFFFYYQNIEYRAMLPSHINQTLGEFLDYFAESTDNSDINDIEITPTKSKHFEVIRNNKFLPYATNIQSLPTKTTDESPIIIVDQNLNLSNLRFRGLNSLVEYIKTNKASQDFQAHLTSLVDNSTFDVNLIDKARVQFLLRSLDDIKGNRAKLIITLISYINIIKEASGVSNQTKLDFKTNYNLKLNNTNKPPKKGLFNMVNCNGIEIPIDISVCEKGMTANQRKEKFSDAIVNNLDTCRKICLENEGIKQVFGIVTDFYNWRFVVYKRNENQSDAIESLKNFNLSTNYDLNLTENYVNEKTFMILGKLLREICVMDDVKMV